MSFQLFGLRVLKNYAVDVSFPSLVWGECVTGMMLCIYEIS